jgi:hypothetical protein
MGVSGASSLVISAAIAYLVQLPERVTAGIKAFGCGRFDLRRSIRFGRRRFRGGRHLADRGRGSGWFARTRYIGLAGFTLRRPSSKAIRRPAAEADRRRRTCHRDRFPSLWRTGVGCAGIGSAGGPRRQHRNAGGDIPVESAGRTVERSRNEAGGQKQGLRIWPLDRYRRRFWAGFSPWKRAPWRHCY